MRIIKNIENRLSYIQSALEKTTIKTDLSVVLLISISLLAFLSITGTINSGYHFADDHEIIRIQNDLDNHSVFDVAKKWIQDDLHLRFRPLYFALRVLQTKLLGTNIFLWSVYTYLLGALTLSLFYLALRKLRFSVIEALLALIIIFVGQQMSVWWRLGPNETPGMVFLSMSFFCMTKTLHERQNIGFNVFFMLFLILASLCKESFIIIIPGMIVYKILLEKELLGISIKSSLNRNKLFVIPLLIMLAELYIIINYVGTSKIGYAGVDSSVLTTINGVITILKTYIDSRIIILFLLGLLLTVLFWKKWSLKFSSLLYSFVFMVMMVTPNLILYAKSGMWDRYLLPSAVGLGVFVVTWLKMFDKSLLVRSILIIGLLMIAIQGAKRSVGSALRFTEEGNSIQSLVTKLEEASTIDSDVLLVVDPVDHYEQSYSLKIYIEYLFNINLFGYAVLNDSDDDFAHRLKRGWNSYYKSRTLNDMQDNPEIIIFFEEDIVEEFYRETNLEKLDYILKKIDKSRFILAYVN